MSVHRTHGRDLSRRNVLRVAVGVGIGGPLLGACGRDEPESEEPAGSSLPTDGGSAKLSGSVSIAIPLATGADQDFYDEAFERFTAETGVAVNFLHFPDPQFAESIQALFQSGEPPDVYRMVKPPAMMKAAWSKDWIQPLDGYAPITGLLADEYGDSALDPGMSGLHIGGELYGVPGVRNADWAVLRPLMYNPEVFDQYGISGPPETWSELADTAGKIVADSGGDVFGFALFSDAERLLTTQALLPLYEAAGPVREAVAQVPVDLQTGQAGASHPSVVDSVALVRGLVEDGSVVPGWQNFDAQQFWQAWAAGQVAMAPISPWWSEEILKVNDQAPLAFAPFPVPDDGRKAFQSDVSTWSPTWGMTQASQNPEAAATLIAYLGSLEVQRDYYEASRVPTALASEYSDVLSETATTILGLVDDLKRIRPNPDVRSVDAEALLAGIQANAPEPSLDQIIFSAIDGGLDYADMAGTFDAALQGVIDDQIAQAIENGADFDENILAFPDWDPMTDYITEPSS